MDDKTKKYLQTIADKIEKDEPLSTSEQLVVIFIVGRLEMLIKERDEKDGR